MPLVSIIIPTYNRSPKFIMKSIQSILQQTFQNFEIIIVDDNKNMTIARDIKNMIIDLKDSRIKYEKNKENIGGAKSRNKGIRLAKGDYITFLDDDDFYLKDKLEKQVYYLEHNDYDFVISNLAILNQNMTIKDLRHFRWLQSRYENNEKLIVEHYKYHLTGTPTFMFTKELLMDVEGFPNVSMGHEFHLVDQALRKGYQLGYLDEYLTIAIAHEGNRISTHTNRQQQLDELLEYKLRHLPNATSSDKRRILYRHYIASTSDHLNNGRQKEAILTAMRAFIHKPQAFFYEMFKIIGIKLNNKGVNINGSK